MIRDEAPGTVRVLSPRGTDAVWIRPDPHIVRVTRVFGCAGPHALTRPAARCACCVSGDPKTAVLSPGAPLTRPCAPWEHTEPRRCPLCVLRGIQRRHRAARLRASRTGSKADALPSLGPALDLVFDTWVDPDVRTMALSSVAGPAYLVLPTTPRRPPEA